MVNQNIYISSDHAKRIVENALLRIKNAEENARVRVGTEGDKGHCNYMLTDIASRKSMTFNQWHNPYTAHTAVKDAFDENHLSEPFTLAQIKALSAQDRQGA